MFNELKETDGMKLMTIFAALLAAFAVGGGIALATGGGSSSGIDLTGNTTEPGTTTGDDGDISGPCDEAEHANDPRCTGVTVPGADDNGDDDGPGDISGPCDEAEHANEPRCTGANPGDSSGPGPGGQDDDDRSGPSGDDNSGHGSGGGDDDDDNSGPGSGSGSGSSGSG
jgi:hypothetical protein